MKKYVNPSLSMIEIAKEDIMSASTIVDILDTGDDAFANDVDWDD